MLKQPHSRESKKADLAEKMDQRGWEVIDGYRQDGDFAPTTLLVDKVDEIRCLRLAIGDYSIHSTSANELRTVLESAHQGLGGDVEPLPFILPVDCKVVARHALQLMKSQLDFDDGTTQLAALSLDAHLGSGSL